MTPPLELEWREVDRLPDGHGVLIYYGEEDGPQVTLAFVVGFAWRRGARHAEVHVLRDADPAWAEVRLELRDPRAQVVEIVIEVVTGHSVCFQRGRFGVIANG